MHYCSLLERGLQTILGFRLTAKFAQYGQSNPVLETASSVIRPQHPVPQSFAVTSQRLRKKACTRCARTTSGKGNLAQIEFELPVELSIFILSQHAFADFIVAQK